MKRSGDWWKLYHDDFWDDDQVILLTAAEQGIYLYLLGLQAKYGSLPSDEFALARLCRRFAEWKKVWPKLVSFFPVGPDGRRRNVRQTFELEEDSTIRKADADRKARWRKSRGISEECPTGQAGDVPPEADEVSPTSRARSDRRDGTDGTGERGESAADAASPPSASKSKPRKPDREPQPELASLLPDFPALDTPAFRELWPTWTTYRVREKRLEPYQPIGMRAALIRLARWGPERAVAAIEHTMAMTWEGIREDDARGSSNGAVAGQSEFTADEVRRGKEAEEIIRLRRERRVTA